MDDKQGDDSGSNDSQEPIGDADGDGWPANEDCDDTDPDIWPGAPESCDGLDSDCDGLDDRDATLHPDEDGDGYGDERETWLGCEGPEGWIADATDCDDSDGGTHPGAEEWCDGGDNNCDGVVDEGIETLLWYADGDGDGYGDPANTLDDCAMPDGYISDGGDCDDTRADVSPDGIEMCDRVDNDCDGAVNAGAVDARWYPDGDGDGYGDHFSTETACLGMDGYVEDRGDCDDADPDVHPGADEIWYDGTDSNCDRGSDFDADGDGVVAEAYDGGDCDDTRADVSPDETERCDGVDNDCDGVVDTSAEDARWYPDGDGDGYGDSNLDAACEEASGLAEGGGDCDDTDADINPGAVETCGDSDGADNNCDEYADPACDEGMVSSYNWTAWDDEEVGWTCTWSGTGASSIDMASDCDESWLFTFTGCGYDDYYSTTFQLAFCYDSDAEVVWTDSGSSWAERALYFDRRAAKTYNFNASTGLLTFTDSWNCSGDPDCGRSSVYWGGNLSGYLFVAR